RLHEGAGSRVGDEERPRKRDRARLHPDRLDRGAAGERPRGAARRHPARPARLSGGRGRGGTLPLLRRGLGHHRGSASRRRRPGDVGEDMSVNGDRRRVVITGLGAVTPLGNDVETTWTNLISGRSGAGPITQFDSTGFPVTFAAEVKDFDPTEWMD